MIKQSKHLMLLRQAVQHQVRFQAAPQMEVQAQQPATVPVRFRLQAVCQLRTVRIHQKQARVPKHQAVVLQQVQNLQAQV